MMYSTCPECSYHFSWRERWNLSATKAYPCPNCKAGLLKDELSEYYINKGQRIGLATLILLQLMTFIKWYFHFTIPDVIELPLCILLAVPPMIIAYVYCLKGMACGKFHVLDSRKDLH